MEWHSRAKTPTSPHFIRRIRFTDQSNFPRHDAWAFTTDARSRATKNALVDATSVTNKKQQKSSVCVTAAVDPIDLEPKKGRSTLVFNDLAVATRAMRAEGLVRRVAVIDTDVHQGNGTAALFADEPEVFTFSVHGARNYPLRKETSDLDCALPDGAGDEPFLSAVAKGLAAALEGHGAELVAYLAGADAHEGDRLGRLGVSSAGLAARDRLVFERCRDAGAAVAVVMGGGYGEDLHETVAIHLSSVREAARAFVA